MTPTRHRPAGVVPLEVWDVVVDDVPLYLHPHPARALPALCARLRSGQATRARGGPLPALAFDVVVLAGGGAAALAAPPAGTTTTLADCGVPVRVVDDPHWCGVAGAARVAAEVGVAGPDVLLVDVGQTAVKRQRRGVRARIGRDHARAPLAPDENADGLAVARAATIAFLAEALRDDVPPPAAVIGLPCELDDDLAAGGASYAWAAPDASLVVDLCRAAGLAATPVWVLNDAELAAVAVRASLPPGQTALVLTLGLGLGGALATGRALDVDCPTSHFLLPVPLLRPAP